MRIKKRGSTGFGNKDVDFPNGCDCLNLRQIKDKVALLKNAFVRSDIKHPLPPNQTSYPILSINGLSGNPRPIE